VAGVSSDEERPLGAAPWECPTCHQVFAPGTAKCDQCGKAGTALRLDLTRDAEIRVTRNGQSERYRFTGVSGGPPWTYHAAPLDEQVPAPPPPEIYILRRYRRGESSSTMQGVYARQEKAKDSAHYWARSERMNWAELIEKPMTWEQSDVPLRWRGMVDSMHGNPTSWICARAGTSSFVIEKHEVRDGPLRHTEESPA
jgi:hypothetical protein